MSKEKKKIIAFIDWYLPGYRAGGGQRAFANMVSYLREDFDFYIITRNTDFQEKKPYKDVSSDEWNKLADGENVYYASASEIGYILFARLLKEVKPDYAYVNGVYSPKFSIFPLLLLKWKKFNGRIVLGTYGMLAPTAIQIKQRKKRFFLKLARLLGLYKNVLFHATSEQEMKDIRAVFGVKYKVKYAPHLPVKEIPEFKKIDKKPGELRLISVARISPEKNTLFALECLQRMKSDGLKIVFDLYGPVYDRKYWEECKKVIKKMPENIDVNFKGIIAGNEVINTISKYHFLFMPPRGENFGYVILESFMAGRPVLISDKTPWRDLERRKAGYDLSLGRIDDFVSKTGELATMSQELFDDLCKGAFTVGKYFLEKPELREENKKLFF
ncbi:MAG: glycosyl transferase [Anaerophaga sp.]|nr:glycosyl transferase [Anaerophaga sp.]